MLSNYRSESPESSDRSSESSGKKSPLLSPLVESYKQTTHVAAACMHPPLISYANTFNPIIDINSYILPPLQYHIKTEG